MTVLADAAGGSRATTSTVLAVDDVHVRFGGVVALDGVGLRLGQGEVRGVIGPNGAGKTTLFDVVAGTRRPARGTVTLGGAEVTGRSELWRARHGIRRTYQRQQLFGGLTVTENVLAALEWRGGGGGLGADLVGLPGRRRLADERREAVARTLERCGLSDYAERQVGSLPLGVGRFVELARALVDQPTVLLLDEPRSGLGTADSARLLELLRDVAAEGRCSLLVVEHDMSFVMTLCERITVLHLGAVLAEGTPEQIQQDEGVRDAYLG